MSIRNIMLTVIAVAISVALAVIAFRLVGLQIW